MRMLILTLLLASQALADNYAGNNPRREIFLRVIHIDSPDNILASEAYQIYQKVTKFYTKNTRIELHPAGFISLTDPQSDMKELGEFKTSDNKLWYHIDKMNLTHKARKREVILLMDKSYNGLKGGSSDVCSLYCPSCYSYTFGGRYREALHEVGHALGVKGHEKEPNSIMYWNPLDDNFILGKYAKKRIRGCNRKTTKRKLRQCRRSKKTRICKRRFRL